jgi:competence protein ComFB
MEIHNLMEDLATSVVNEICDEDQRTHTYNYCVSEPCRVDAVCYVLNRMPPRYVSSGRGMAYVESEYTENPQLHVDVYTLAHEALRRITQVQRSYYQEGAGATRPEDAGIAFHFPAIKGRLFHALTFEPMENIDIELLWDGERVPMIDARWSNPYRLVGHTYGTYTFRPAPLPASEAGETRTVEFEVRAECSGFEPFRHFFQIEATASRAGRSNAGDRARYDLPDLYMIPR